jgi:hypothetical protein
MKLKISIAVTVATSLLIVACTSKNDDTLTGTFVDSAVEGMDYKTTPSGGTGKTNADGKYNFKGGDTVTFTLGGIVLGEMKATTDVVSPIDLFEDEASSSQKVINIARILQSLDEDRDPTNGLKIPEESVKILNEKVGCTVGAACDVDLSTYDTASLNTLLDAVVLETEYDDKVVTEDYALDHLLTSIGEESSMIRKNISKTPEFASAKSKMNRMSIYVDAQKADGTPVYTDDTQTTRLRVHPIVVTYADAVDGAGLQWDGTPGHDTFAAISLDDGETWKRINLSRTATRSSFEVKDGDTTRPYPGHTHKPVMQANGNNILVVWDSKFCRSGNPLGLTATDENGTVIGDMTTYDGNVTYEDDLYLVNGSQDSVDYAEISINGVYPFTDVGEVPYSCVMASRTVINPDAETPEDVITTYVAEQITSGRRDALQIFLASSPDGSGFGFTWQEDPEGLRPGSGKGPGAGWGGATTNHKTDIWYSYIKMENFVAVDEDFVASNPDPDQLSTEPVDGVEVDSVEPRPHALNKFALPVRITDNAVCTKTNADAGLSSKYCKYMCDTYGVSSETNTSSPTFDKCYGPAIDPLGDGIEHVLLDGDTGASRPNIFIQPGKYNGVSRAIAIFGYEETKGLGDGAPEDSGIPVEGEDDTNWTDTGKYVMYESFPFDEPEVLGHADEILDAHDAYVISNGNILNVPNKDGIYENARRIRFIPQGMKSTLSSEEDIVLGAVFKQGMEGQGRPSDILLARWKGGYSIDNVVKDTNGIYDIQNISSVTPTETDEESNTTKVLAYDWNVSNLDDETGDNPYDDARAHRGIIRGDFMAVAYSYTPNWAAARIAHDTYDLMVRRSFDGGKTWTNAAGESEGPVNMSNLANNQEVVVEPRLVGTPGTILTDGALADPRDKQNQNIFYLTYGTAENIPNVVGSLDEDAELEAGAPLDLFYTRTTDKGETYEMVEQTITSDDSNLTGEVVTVWDWFAHSDASEAEVQIRMTPDGSVFYGAWNQELDMNATDTPEHFRGSDIWFRKIDYNAVVSEDTE